LSRGYVEHTVGHVDDFEVGKFRIFEIERRSIGVVNTGDSFYAVLNVCPHALAPICEGGPVTGTSLPSSPAAEPVHGLRGRIVRCPWHHYEFDLGDDGRCVFTDFKAKVRLFPVTLDDGEVKVRIRARPDAVGVVSEDTGDTRQPVE
jgi:3-phenylpropionate/trans-cinnamate dioxygenase ferredoxin subunit